MFHHAVYGLRIRSDVALAGLKPHPREDGTRDLEIRHAPLPALPPPESHARRPWGSDHGPAYAERLSVQRIEPAGDFLLEYPDGTRFLISSEGRHVTAETPAGATLEDTATYLLGPVLALVLRLRGTVALHAAAVEVDGQAVLLAGPPGAGKSTTAAALALRGLPVLSDDVTPLAGGDPPRAVSAYPRLRLWPDAAEMLFHSEHALPPLTPNWDKRYLDVAERPDGGRGPVPIGAVYVLAARASGADAPRIEPLDPRGALLALLASSYGPGRMDAGMRRHDFQVLSALARAVRVRKLVPAADPALLPALCDLVLADARRPRTVS